MKYVCKEAFEINGILVGNKGNILVINDAVPKENENSEDVQGYCDIENLTTHQIYEATWIDVDESVLEVIEQHESQILNLNKLHNILIKKTGDEMFPVFQISE